MIGKGLPKGGSFLYYHEIDTDNLFMYIIIETLMISGIVNEREINMKNIYILPIFIAGIIVFGAGTFARTSDYVGVCEEDLGLIRKMLAETPLFPTDMAVFNPKTGQIRFYELCGTLIGYRNNQTMEDLKTIVRAREVIAAAAGKPISDSNELEAIIQARKLLAEIFEWQPRHDYNIQLSVMQIIAFDENGNRFVMYIYDQLEAEQIFNDKRAEAYGELELKIWRDRDYFTNEIIYNIRLWIPGICVYSGDDIFTIIFWTTQDFDSSGYEAYICDMTDVD